MTRWPRILVLGTCVVALAIGVSGVGGCAREPAPGQPIAGARVIGGLGDTPGRFAYPRCLEASADALWVIDRSGRVQRIDPATGRCTGFFHMPAYDVGKPVGFGIGPGLDEHGVWTKELLYIADTHYHRVLVFKAPPAAPVDPNASPPDPKIEPTLVKSFGSYGTGDAQFYYPTDVAILLTPDGKHVDRLYVGEYGGNDRINIFDGSYNYVRSFGTFGTDASASHLQFNRPQSLAIDTVADGTKRLIVTDACNHRVGVLTLDGKLIRWIGLRAGVTGESIDPKYTQSLPPSATFAGEAPKAVVGKPATFLYPYGLKLLGDGTALVSEFGGARVQRIDLDTGICLASWGRPGRRDGELAAPWGVTVLNGKVYVLDSGNCRILEFPEPKLRSGGS